MTPRIHMPILRQLARDPDAPLLGRLRQFRAPVVYELVHDYMIHVSGYGHLWLPAGFRSDLASTPRPTWLCGGRPDGLFLIPGLYHDWYYRHGGVEERVSMQSERGRWTVTLATNGTPPAGEIRERGGLRNLRAAVEDAGGDMRVRSLPGFLLTLHLPKGGTDHAL